MDLDIADVIAGAEPARDAGVADDVSPLGKCYNTIFLSVEEGLRSYARSLEILNISKGIESPWEVKFSQTFLQNSKLSADMNSLRELEDLALTRDALEF